jgi:hypothetical protein
MTRSNEQEKKPGKQRTKSSPEMKKMAARANGLPWTSLVGQVTGHPAAFVVVLLPPSGSYSTDNILTSMRSQRSQSGL